jgi:ABC-2 type transport system ATP-binding protein
MQAPANNSPAHNSPAISVRGLEKSYGRLRPKSVLRGVNLTVEPGMVMGLVGTNGEGKSTLINCLLGLLRSSGGEMRVFGEDPWDLSPAAKARIGYVPQEPALLPWMTVRQQLAYTAAFFPDWDANFAAELISQWGLPWDERLGPLSLGQKQKVSIVLALAHRPELLVLDEPVASLDPVARRKFLESLMHATERPEQTVLFSTHITSDLERIASHVAILKDGRIAVCEELDRLKDRVKRLRISAGQELPRSFAIGGALRTEVHGRNALVAVATVDDGLVDELRTRWGADVSVEDLNLEEIFMELHLV